MVSYMQKRLFRMVSAQKKFISKFSKSNHNQMVLHKPQKSKSLILCGDDSVNKKLYQTNEIKAIRSNCSRVFLLFNSNCFVFYKDTEQVPVIEEVTDESEMPAIGFTDLFRWFAKTKDSGGKDTRFRGVRVGRLDAANEAGFFHRTERSRLREIKKKLKDKGKDEPTEPKKTQ